MVNERNESINAIKISKVIEQLGQSGIDSGNYLSDFQLKIVTACQTKWDKEQFKMWSMFPDLNR